MEVHVRAPLGVQTDQFLQSRRFDDVETRLASEGAGLPVLWRVDGIPKQAFQGERGSHLHHALSEYGVGASFLHYEAGIKLQGINVAIELL